MGGCPQPQWVRPQCRKAPEKTPAAEMVRSASRPGRGRASRPEASDSQPAVALLARPRGPHPLPAWAPLWGLSGEKHQFQSDSGAFKTRPWFQPRLMQENKTEQGRELLLGFPTRTSGAGGGGGGRAGTWEERESRWGETGGTAPSFLTPPSAPRPSGSSSKWTLSLSPWFRVCECLRRHISRFPLKSFKRSHGWGAVAGCWQPPLTPAPPRSLPGPGLSRWGEPAPGPRSEPAPGQAAPVPRCGVHPGRGSGLLGGGGGGGSPESRCPHP